jgi:CHAT domain-containing protein
MVMRAMILATALSMAPAAQGMAATQDPIAAARSIDIEADPAGAVAAWQAALPAARARFRATPAELGQVLVRYGSALIGVGRDKEALPLLEEAAPLLAVLPPDDPARLTGAIALALGRASAGRTAEAVAMLEEVAAIQRAAAPGGSTALAETLFNIGSVEQQAGHLSTAAERVEEALALHRRLSPPDAEVTVGTATSLSSIYTQAGLLAKAEDVARDALAMAARGLPQDHPLTMITLSNYAAVLDTQGRWRESEPLYRRLLPLRIAKLGKEAISTAITESNFGRALRLSARPEEALPLLEESVRVAERKLGASDPRLNQFRENLADDYRDLGRLADAVALRRQAIAAFRVDFPRHFRLASLQEGLSADLAALGDMAAARAEIEQAQAIRHATLAPDHPALLGGEIAAGHLLARAGDGTAGLARALPAYRRLAAIANANQTEISRDLVFRGAFETMARLAWLTQDQPLALDVAQRLVIGDSGRAITAALARGRSEQAERVRARQDATARRAALSRVALERYGRDSAGYEAALAEIAKIDAAMTGQTEATRDMIVDMDGLRGTLDRGQAQLYFVQLDDRLLSLAVDRDHVAFGDSAIGDRALHGLVAGLRGSIDTGQQARGAIADGGGPRAYDGDAAARLYDLLLHGAPRRIAERNPRWRIATSGSLLAVPFAALVTQRPAAGRAPRWVIDDHAILLAAGGASPDGASPGSGRFVGIGAPLLKGSATGGARTYRDAGGVVRDIAALAPLPGAAHELAAMRAKIGGPDSVVLLGADATEAAVRGTRLTDVRVLTFATHGLVAGDVTGLLEPALVLTPAAQGDADDDGLLTASEIAQLTTDAALVVLSACDTAAGDSRDAPALSGLARAFFYAGARSLLVSHWPVRDDIAARITVAVARDGRAAPEERLRRAILDIRRDRRMAGADRPETWAPFALVSR